MRYKSIQVSSFRSIRESPELHFDKRITVIVGENNSGKSALLDAMWQESPSAPHASPATVPIAGTKTAPTAVRRVVSGDARDIHQVMSIASEPIWFACEVSRRESVDSAVDTLLACEEFAFSAPLDDPRVSHDYLGIFDLRGGLLSVRLQRDVQNAWIAREAQWKPSAELRTRLMKDLFAQCITRIKAERPRVTSGTVGTSIVAGPTSENLASALHYLHSIDPPLMQRVVDAVCRIVPSVKRITVPNLGGPQVGIYAWPFKQAHLAVAIDNLGTGVWQVIALAFGVITADRPKVFLIDEPNNYLHPKAVLDLIALLKEHPQHQYVIATHSPEVISACEPGIVHRVWLEEGESRFEQIDPSKVADQRRTLHGLGVRLSAFFGADEVLWVEGPTEEAVFPKLLAPNELSGLRILAVHDTGPFSKNPERIAAIYKKLVDGIALIPPAVGFFFDREDQTQEQVDQLKVTLGDKLALTKRRLLECYFLDPQAIAETITEAMQAAGDTTFVISSTRVEECIREFEANGRRFSATKRYDDDRNRWLETVHAAKLLNALFGALTDTRLSYQKTWHGPAIVDRILARDPGLLDPLRNELRAVIERGRQSDEIKSE